MNVILFYHIPFLLFFISLSSHLISSLIYRITSHHIPCLLFLLISPKNTRFFPSHPVSSFSFILPIYHSFLPFSSFVLFWGGFGRHQTYVKGTPADSCHR